MLLAAGSSDVLRGAAVGIVTLVVVLAALIVIGFVVLFRRRGNQGAVRDIHSPTVSTDPSIDLRAGSLLVRMDDAVRDADDELGFAIAQFGPEPARGLSTAIGSARSKVGEAFRLRQALDDATPESPQRRREWTLQIIALCEQADQELTTELSRFAELRRREVDAAGTLADIRARIDAARDRLDAARTTLSRLTTLYSPSTSAEVAGNPDRAEAELDAAARAVDAAAPGISAAGVSAVSGTLDASAQSVRRAVALLGGVDRVASNLDSAADAAARLRSDTREDLAEARTELDRAPDADTGQAIIDAMADVESALAPRSGPADPVADLDRIGDAVARLDLALAGARNQAQRLTHAKAAYEGTLVSATSQIAVVRDYIGAHGGGASARTRLAEAERQLMLARAETDPVEALDAVRRAVTHARDADALARY